MVHTTYPELRSQLLARQTELQDEVSAHRQQLVEPAAQTGNTFIAGSEGAVADADDELEIALLQRVESELDDVNAALRRLDAGNFGTCEHCNAPIGLPRLRALPQARLCMRCQRAADDGAKLGIRR